MGNLSILQEMQINEVTVQDNGTAVIGCAFFQDAKLQIIVHDNLGRNVLSEYFHVKVSTDKLLIDTTNLKPGNFHAWVYVGDKVFIKHFSLPEVSDSGFLNKIFSKFR